jgi:hypothetical protein
MLEKMELRDYFPSQDRTGIGPERSRITPEQSFAPWGVIGPTRRIKRFPGRTLVFMIYRINLLAKFVVSISLTRTHPRPYNLTVIHI